MNGPILITGATGAIGSALTRDLEARGEEVIALGRADGDLLAGGVAEGLIETHRPATLVHLAWGVRGSGYPQSGANREWLEASVALLEAFAAAGGGRVMVAGTCVEYAADAFAAGRPVSESAPLIAPASRGGEGDSSPYARAKRELFERASAIDGIELLWPRIFFVFSGRDEPGRLLGDVRAAAAAGKPITVRSGGLFRDYLPATAVGEALAALLAAGAAGPVNVGAGNGMRLGDLVAAAAEALGLAAEMVEDRGLVPPASATSIVADTTRLAELSDWRPPATVADAVALELGGAR